VLYLITKSNWGGAQRYVYDLATHINDHLEVKPPSEKWEAIVVCGGNGLFVDKLRDKNIRVIPLPEAQRDIAIFKEIKLLFTLFKIVITEGPDILHVNSSKLGGMGAFVGFITRTRTIFTAHGWPFNEDRNPLTKFTIYFFSWLTSSFADITITITDSDFAQGKNMPFASHKMRMIHNAIEQIDFYSRDEARQILIQRSGLKNLNQRPNLGAQIWIGAIAELTSNKGLEYLTKSAEQISDVKFVIIGEGELRQKLSTTRLNLVGFIPEANKSLKAFDIFVLPSLKEGLPYVLLEAAQAGLPVVASNVGGVPDVIGEAGMLMPPKNHELLTRALKALISNPELRTQLGSQLQARVSKEFNFENFLSKTYYLYK